MIKKVKVASTTTEWFFNQLIKPQLAFTVLMGLPLYHCEMSLFISGDYSYFKNLPSIFSTNTAIFLLVNICMAFIFASYF